MKRQIENWTIHEILEKLQNGQLNYKPDIQRQFVYNNQQQQQVIVSIKNKFLTASLVVERTSPNMYVLLDGKQRINSIIGFINGAFTVDKFYFDDSYRTDRVDPAKRYIAPHIISGLLPPEDKSDSATLLNYIFPVVVYSDMTEEERLALFNVINTTGEPLNTWELVNGRYPSGLLLDMRANYFNEKLAANTTTLDPNYICVKKFEKYFGTHDVNRGELYIKILEKVYQLSGGLLDDQPYEVVDGIIINTKNYNKLCKFVENHQQEKFEDFAKVLIEHLDVFYNMFKEAKNLGCLKEACFNIVDNKFYQAHETEFSSTVVKSNLQYLITQYLNSDIKNNNNHEEYFTNNILPLALVLPPDFRQKLDTKRFYDSKDKERIFIANLTFDPASFQVQCHGIMNDGKTPCGCNKWLNKEDATVDHIVPWVLGGRTEDENAQILCRSCNSSKGAKIISDILAKKIKLD